MPSHQPVIRSEPGDLPSAERLHILFRLAKSHSGCFLLHSIGRPPELFGDLGRWIARKEFLERANVALCPHHEQKSVGQEVLLETKENTPIYISDEELEYGDATLREIIAESIMYANVNKSRRDQGIPPLGVTTHMLSSRSFDDVE